MLKQENIASLVNTEHYYKNHRRSAFLIHRIKFLLFLSNFEVAVEYIHAQEVDPLFALIKISL